MCAGLYGHPVLQLYTLKPLENSKTELLLSVTELPDNGTAENETEAITKQLNKYHIDNKTVGFCFDTTAVTLV